MGRIFTLQRKGQRLAWDYRAVVGLSVLSLLLSATAAGADHGPGTAGGGVATMTGQTLAKGGFTVGLTGDYTQFDHLNASQIDARTRKVSGHHAHFDAIRYSLLETIELAYGLTDDLQLGVSFGYYQADDLREGHIHGDGSYGYHNYGDIGGPTDPWLSAKYRVLKHRGGHLAVLGGVKFPLGDDDEFGNGGRRSLEPSLQPGSGAFDYMVGVAYSRWLTSHLSLDTSAQYTFRTRHDHYEIGDRYDMGTALSYRLTEASSDFPQWSVVMEGNLRDLQKNDEGGSKVPNSGGTAYFLSPGVRLGLCDGLTLRLAVPVPVIQELNDEQQETDYKVTTGVTYAF